MKENKMMRNALALVLAVAMTLNMGMNPVFAVGTPIGEGDIGSGVSSPIYTDSAMSDTVIALIAMVDAMPVAGAVTDKNRQQTRIDFDQAQVLYKSLPATDKAVFEKTPQYKKFGALRPILYNSNWTARRSAKLNPADLNFTGELPSKDDVAALLEQMYQRSSVSLMNEEDQLETIVLENRNSRHRAVGELPSPKLVRDSGIAPRAMVDASQSGSFDEGDERYFRIEVLASGTNEAYRAVLARLVATGDNSNVWVVDDDDFHKKIDTVHDDAICKVRDVSYDIAKDLATGFDGIYSRVTTAFGPFKLYETPNDTMSQIGDLGDDGDVNILLYSIDALDKDGGQTLGYFWESDMYAVNRNYGDSEDIHPIDMFHVDISTEGGWNGITGSEEDRLDLYGTLAHEFQHMLFAIHFGFYIPDDQPLYLWFNESLSGLAEMYYVQPGAEIIRSDFIAFGASNPYEGNGYGDMFMFNNSTKNYGMGFLFSALLHKYTGGSYAEGIYDFLTTGAMANDGTIEGFNAKYSAVHAGVFEYPLYHIGAMLNAGLDFETSDYLAVLQTAYLFFMENFASDGGLKVDKSAVGDELISPSHKVLRGNDTLQNLWGIRPLLGDPDGGMINLPAVPEMQSGGQIIIDNDIGYQDTTRDMLYKLEGSGTAISLTLPTLDERKTAYLYLVLKNPDDATGVAGADIYPLSAGDNEIVTHNRDAYLFAATFMSSIDETDRMTVEYTWWGDEAVVGTINGIARIDTLTPHIGDTVGASFENLGATDIVPDFSWYVGDRTDPASVTDSYIVQDADVGLPIAVYIADQTKENPLDGVVKAITAPVKKRLYTGTEAAAPVAQAVTHNSVTLGTLTASSQYSNSGMLWQDTPVFNGLSPNVEYTFYSRIRETDTMQESEASSGTKITTAPLDVHPLVITTQPVGATYIVGETITPLHIVVSDDDPAKLSYRWYKNTTDSTIGGSLVSNTTAAAYLPIATTVGTVYYYCVVSKTIEGKTVSATSNTVAILWKIRPTAATITVDGSYTYNGMAQTPAKEAVTVKNGGTTLVEGTDYTFTARNNTNAGTATLQVTFKGNYVGGATATFTIRQAVITIAVNNKSAYIYDAAPVLGASDYTVSGLIAGETLRTAPTIEYETTPNMSRAGLTTIIVREAKAPDGGNYDANIIYQSGTLTVSKKPDGSGDTTGSDLDGIGFVIESLLPIIQNSPTSMAIKVNSKTDQNGKTIAIASEKLVLEALKTGQAEAKKNGTVKNGIAVVVDVATDKNTTSLETTFPPKAIAAMLAAGTTGLTIKNGLSTVALDQSTLKALTGGEVKLTINKIDPKTLSPEAQKSIGNRPVFRFGLTSGGKAVLDFKGGRVHLQMPYTPAGNETTSNLLAVYVDDAGKSIWLEASRYDPTAGSVLTSTTHFSVYGVGYKGDAPKFTDTAKHWAKDDIDFVAARGLLRGTSTTAFAPDQSITRGMLVTALGRLAGVDISKFRGSKFADVKATADYAPYVAWAVQNNIINSTSDTTFSPDQAVTRQEIAVVLVNYSKAIGYKLPRVHAEIAFADASRIGTWAKDAVKQMQMAGILSGKSGNRFDPTATATKAEGSAMLRRYVELLANTETAEGWSMNESGEWMYIENGKRTTGSKTINGKPYTFDAYGVTASIQPEGKENLHTVQIGESFWSIAWKYKVSMFELAQRNGKTLLSMLYIGEELKIPQKEQA